MSYDAICTCLPYVTKLGKTRLRSLRYLPGRFPFCIGGMLLFYAVQIMVKLRVAAICRHCLSEGPPGRASIRSINIMNAKKSKQIIQIY